VVKHKLIRNTKLKEKGLDSKAGNVFEHSFDIHDYKHTWVQILGVLGTKACNLIYGYTANCYPLSRRNNFNSSPSSING
jgi:hypothetical protein